MKKLLFIAVIGAVCFGAGYYFGMQKEEKQKV